MHHDEDTDDLDFAMLTPPTRPGPCKADSTSEVEPVDMTGNANRAKWAMSFKSVEVQHGSGKVKV